MKRNDGWLWAAAAISLTTLWSAGSAGGDDCGAARREVKRAQATLAQSTRAADRAAASYHTCKQKRRGGCARARKRMVSTRKEKARARDAYRFARARQKQACK